MSNSSRSLTRLQETFVSNFKKLFVVSPNTNTFYHPLVVRINSIRNYIYV